MDALRRSPLATFEALAAFDLYARDSHYLEHATHDPVRGETRWPTSHFFALKRQSVALLRQGAGKGRKVLWVWDKAGVDLPFWQERRAAGIYFLSLRKEGMCLTAAQERVMDLTQPINQGVTADRVVTDRRGLWAREITFRNPCDAEVYVYLTLEMTLEPGLLALLCKTRREIEKVFDETKTKLQEKKSWATTTAAKEMQSHFVAIVHNLPLRLQAWHQRQGVENTAEMQRRQKRVDQQASNLEPTGQTLQLACRIL